MSRFKKFFITFGAALLVLTAVKMFGADSLAKAIAIFLFYWLAPMVIVLIFVGLWRLFVKNRNKPPSA